MRVGGGLTTISPSLSSTIWLASSRDWYSANVILVIFCRNRRGFRPKHRFPI
jgi:hypothetical protein